MLLVKSRELKSLGNKSSCKTWGYLLAFPCFLVSHKAFSAPETLSNPTSILSIFLSLLVVVAVVFCLALLMRRFNVTQAGSGQMKVVASMMAGTKERVVVLQVGDEQYLLGITAHNINHLAKLDTPIVTEFGAAGENFKDKLVQAMAAKIAPNNNKAGRKND